MSRFCVAVCPDCEKRFRLVWHIGGRKLSLSQVIRLTCPHCGCAFEQESVELVVFDSGAEDFPAGFTVEPSCLIGAATYECRTQKGMNTAMFIGKRLREVREARKLSQGD